MHTATQLDQTLFSVRIDGAISDRDAVLPAWDPRDRLGVIVDEPFGGVGASHLIQLVTTAFYDVRPSRRDTSRSGPHGEVLAQYADIYLFHVGGPWGDHSYFDVWPSRKEVRVGTDPRDLLDAVLDRAITWLAVPDREPTPTEFFDKDPAEAYDRIKGAWAYAAGGRTRDADVEIAGLDRRTEFNPRQVLEPERVLERIESARRAGLEASRSPALRERGWEAVVKRRAGEAEHGLRRAAARREKIRGEDGTATETYRRIPVGDALWMLSPAADGGQPLGSGPLTTS